MIRDKNGEAVKEGYTIKFSNSELVYKVIINNGLLEAHEDGEFIPLKDVLRNFVITHR